MEALDLGATLCQSAARSTFTCYLLVAVPTIAIALATYEPTAPDDLPPATRVSLTTGTTAAAGRGGR